jgi:hypothetical protein
MSNRTVEITITDDETGLRIANQFSVDVIESFKFGRATFLEMKYMDMLGQINKSVVDRKMNDSFGGTVDEAQFVESVPIEISDELKKEMEYTKIELLRKIDKELERMNPKPEPTNYDKSFCTSDMCDSTHECARHVSHYQFDMSRRVRLVDFTNMIQECDHFEQIKEDE